MNASRLLLIDDNVRTVGGHYFELMTLLAGGAARLGYQPTVAINKTFDSLSAFPRQWNVQPVFQTRRMVRWSMGVDGGSLAPRGLQGQVTHSGPWMRARSALKDRMVPADKRPRHMLSLWKENFSELIDRFRPTVGDRILVNTADDFSIIALADVLRQFQSPDQSPVHVDALLHFALVSPSDEMQAERLAAIGKQLRTCCRAAQPHRIELHATTEPLAKQYRATGCGAKVRTIPYPTRPATLRVQNMQSPINAVLAGLPRAEKGRDAIEGLLTAMSPNIGMRSDQFRCSIQLPTEGWEPMVPVGMQPLVRAAMDQPEIERPISVQQSNLDTMAYHGWLDTADIGVFLYDPERYQARCSGVLLEMMVRGIPVIVPDRCHLAEEVRGGGGHRGIGFIYQDRSEIPSLLQQFQRHRERMVANAHSYAPTIARRHDAANSVRSMGIRPVRRVAA